MSEPTPGYIYALINRTMPGLVKVGLTTRAPLERLAELSSATGVPTPFELVFDVLVADAPRAEALLHELLTKAGYRVAENREFFAAPIREVVRLMLQVREAETHPSLSSAEPASSIPLHVQAAAHPPQPRSRLWDAAMIVTRAGQASTSVLQRTLSIGYGEAARLIDQLETAGVVGPAHGANPRKVLIKATDVERLIPPP